MMWCRTRVSIFADGFDIESILIGGKEILTNRRAFGVAVSVLIAILKRNMVDEEKSKVAEAIDLEDEDDHKDARCGGEHNGGDEEYVVEDTEEDAVSAYYYSDNPQWN